MVVQIVADANGAGLSAMEIYRRLGQQGTPLAMSALYRDLRELTERGRLYQEWFSRGGHLAALYRLTEAPRTIASRLVCRGCSNSVDLPDPEALGRVVAEICRTLEISVSTEPLEIQVLCRSCEQQRAGHSTRTQP